MLHFADIDARFSKISTSLRRRHAKTLPELLSVIRDSTEQPMVTEIISCVYNIRDWIEPTLQELHNHTNPHVFQ